MKTRIEQMLKLHRKAEALLMAAQDMGWRIENIKKRIERNSVVFGIKEHTDYYNRIDTCERGQKRLIYSYKKVLMQIAEL